MFAIQHFYSALNKKYLQSFQLLSGNDSKSKCKYSICLALQIDDGWYFKPLWLQFSLFLEQRKISNYLPKVVNLFLLAINYVIIACIIR